MRFDRKAPKKTKETSKDLQDENIYVGFRKNKMQVCHKDTISETER